MKKFQFQDILQQIKYHGAGEVIAKAIKENDIPYEIAVGGAAEVMKAFATFAELEKLGHDVVESNLNTITQKGKEVSDFGDKLIEKLNDEFDGKSYDFIIAAMYHAITRIIEVRDADEDGELHECTNCGACGKPKAKDSNGPKKEVHIAKIEIDPRNPEQAMKHIMDMMDNVFKNAMNNKGGNNIKH